MEAITNFLDAIYDFVVSLWDMLTSIVGWIADIIMLPGKALDTLLGFSGFFPDYFWTALVGILGVVIIFRFLKIYKSGG